MYTINMDTFILLGPSIVSGVLIGLIAKRPLPFIALIFIAPVAISGGIYLADLIHMQNIGRSYNESWAGLFIPFVSAASFIFLAPAAIGAAGIKWILSQKRKGS
jgi:hypothetical protein